MSSKGGSSRGRPSSSNHAASRASASRPAELAGPSTHRFADRRQERMRGAGTQVAMQRDFQFKLPTKRAATAASSTTALTIGPDASTSGDSSEIKRRRGRPRGSGPKQKERAALEAAAAAATAGDAFEASVDLDLDPRLAAEDESGFSQQPDASSSIGVARRAERPRLSGPISSTPAASRVQKRLPTASTTAGSARNDPRERGADHGDDDELGSQLDYADDYLRDDSGSSGGAAVQGSPGWNAVGMDESLPMIPSPAASSQVDASVRRMRPSIAGTSASRLSIADSTLVRGQADSPAARAAQRNLDTRQRRRQGSPGAERPQRPGPKSAPKRRGKPMKSLAQGPTRARALVQEPTELDETIMDRTLIERQRGVAVPARSNREVQKRLKRALTLVFSTSEAAALGDDGDDDSGAPPSKKRKSVKYLNDVDIIWSIVDEELRSAIEEQPAKAPFLALKALRKSVRTNFLNLSEKTDARTTLISQLVRARKQKRQLRKDVFAKRAELAKSTVEASERKKEMNDWSKEATDVRKVNAFLLNLRHQASAWS